MRPLRAWLMRFGSLFSKQRRDRELAAELESHLQMHVEDNLRAGMTPEEARRQALIKLGGVEQTKEKYRDRRGLPWLESFLQDVRFGLRMLRKNPGFTAVAVLTLALGIGANTAIFSVVNGILLAPLPFAKPEQLVSLTGMYPKGAFVAMREQIHTMAVCAYSEGHEFNLTGFGEPVRLNGTLVSAELFSLLGARPELGRTFDSGEDAVGNDNFVILSHALWQQRFGSNPLIIGREVEIEGVGRQVVGVMPADFRFPSLKTQIWIPLHNDPRNIVPYWAGDFMPVIGRVHPGSTIGQVRAEIRIFQSRVTELFPWPMPANWNAGVSVVPLQDSMVADVRVRLLILLGAVVMVLLIACANVANMMLARAATRQKEIAIRHALGAGRGRVARQLLTESVLLAAAGGLLGLVFAAVGLSMLKAALPADTPRLMDVHIDWRVLAFTGVLACLTGLISGLVPALQSSRSALTDSLKSGGRGASASVSRRLRSSLVIVEVSLAVLLVTAAGLLIRSSWALSHVDPGFKSEHILTARITPDESLCSDAGRCLAFYDSLLSQVQGTDGVNGAAVVNTLPLGGRVSKRSMDVEDYVVPPGKTSPLFWLNIVSPDYFRVMRIPLLSGRGFVNSDMSGNPPAAVITAATAHQFWPRESALGKHIRLLGDKNWRTVVGIIPDVRAYDLQRDVPDWIEGTAYIPYSPNSTLEDGRVPAEMTIAIRTTLDESQAGPILRKVVTDISPEVPISEIRPMTAIVSDAVSTPSSTTPLFVAFAVLALALGIFGIYGVLAFLVSKRTREIAIRVALGAQRRDVLWLIIKDGAKLSVAGITLGLVGAFAATRLLSSELFGVSPLDPATYAGVAILMSMAMLLACYIPARRAMRVDPMVALRHE